MTRSVSVLFVMALVSIGRRAARALLPRSPTTPRSDRRRLVTHPARMPGGNTHRPSGLFRRGVYRHHKTAAAAHKVDEASHYYVTTPIYYVNAEPHVGHAYTSIACDAAARFARLDGREAFLATGTDEHGEKVEESAKKEKVEPLVFATKVSDTFRALADAYDVSYDDFVRTTDARHERAVTKVWEKLRDNGDLYLSAYEGWYCVRDECYYTEGELIDGKAPTGADVEWREKEPSYFFRLSKYQQKLLELYETNSIIITPQSRRNEILSFLNSQDLRDLSVSRTTFRWGVKVPEDDDHVIYVWIDALCNYLTALGYPDNDTWERKWRDGDTVHVVGKDILRFHAVYWPAICLSADIDPPKTIVAHGWWTKDGQKISKSLGNTVDPFELLESYGVDVTRYFLLSEVPFGNDGDFSKRSVLAAGNGYLANAVGNFAQRVCTMLNKAPCVGEAPTLPVADDVSSFSPDSPPDLLDKARALPDAMRPYLFGSSKATDDDNINASSQSTPQRLRFDLALREVETVVREANKYFDAAAPWQLKKSDPDAMLRVLAVSLELLRCIGIAYQPFMPRAAAKILDQIGVPPDQRAFRHLADVDGVAPGTPLAKPKPVFPRIPEEEEAAVPS